MNVICFSNILQSKVVLRKFTNQRALYVICRMTDKLVYSRCTISAVYLLLLLLDMIFR